MRKPVQSWWTTWFKLGFVRKRPEKRRREKLHRRPQVETLEKREVYAISVTSFGLTNDTGTPGDLITSDPRVTVQVGGSFMSGAAIQFDHNGDGNVDGSSSVSSPGQSVIYDPRITQPSLSSYSGSFPLRYRTMEYVMPSGQQVFGSWTNFTFTITPPAAQPSLQVRQQNGTPIANGSGQQTFGSTNVGTPVDRTIIIANQGSGALNITANSWVVPNGYQIVGTAPTSVAANSQANLVLRMTAQSAGFFSGQVQFASNDPTNGTFSFYVTGDASQTSPQMEVRDNGTLVADNSGSVNFGSTVTGSAVTKTFTIYNSGTANLTLGTISLPSGYTLVTPPSSTVMAGGGMTTFQVRLDATAAGTYTGRFSIATNDPTRNPYDFDLTGTVVAGNPEIVVNYNPGSGTIDVVDNTGVVDFGTVAYGQQVQRTFTIQNTGNSTLNLGSVSLPSGFSLFSSPPSSIAAGGSASFTVALYGSPGSFSGQLTFTTNDADENPFNFTIQGTINPPPPDIQLELVVSGSSPQNIPSTGGSVSFGTAYLGENKTQTINIRNFGQSTLNISNITLPTGFELTAAAPTTVAANGTVAIVVRMLGDTPGNRSGNLVITSNDPDESPLSVQLTGQVLDVAPKIEVRETNASGAIVTDGTGSINWGDVDVNTTATKTFHITNVGAVALSLNSGSLSLPAGFTVQQGFATSLDPGASTTLVIQFAPTQSQAYGGTLSFTTTDPTAQTFDFTVAGNGVVRPAEIEVKNGTVDLVDGSSTVDVGTTYAGTSLNKTITIKNTGGQTLSINTSSFVLPSGFAMVTLPDATVAAGGTTTFVIRLTGATIGSYSGTLSFSSDDADESPFDITLTGTVVADPWNIPGTVSNVALQNDTGASSTDKITADSRIRGTVAGVLNGGTARVEFDHDGDGDVDGSVTITDGLRDFIYDGRLSDPSLVTQSGAWTVNYRVVKVDTNGVDGPVSGWTSFDMTLAPNPVAAQNVQLKEDTGFSSSDFITSKPAIQGNVTGEFAGGLVRVEFDHDGDGIVDGSTTVATSGGQFVYDPSSDQDFMTVGAHVLSYRIALLAANGTSVQQGQWTDIAMEIVADPVSHGASLDHLDLFIDLGTSEQDRQAVQPVLYGLVHLGSAVGSVRIEFDHDGDGVAEGNIVVGQSESIFIYDPGTQNIQVPLGLQDWNVRLIPIDANETELDATAWAPFRFTLIAPPASRVTLASLGFDDQVLDGGVAVTPQPVLKGQLTLPATAYFGPSEEPTSGAFDETNVLVEVDFDLDGTADRLLVVTRVNDDGRFEIDLGATDRNVHQVAFRIREWAPDLQTHLVSSWQTFSWRLAAPTALAVTNLELANDTGTAGDGITRDATIRGQVSAGTASVTIEFDTNGDNVVDDSVVLLADGTFEWTPDGLGLGAHTIRARAVFTDPVDGPPVVGAWSSTTFTLTALEVAGLSSLQLVEPSLDGQGRVISSTLSVAATYSGPGTLVDRYVEFDFDGDGSLDDLVKTDAVGIARATLPTIPGATTIRARLIEFDPIVGSFVGGTWTSLTFDWVPPVVQAPAFTVELASPTASGHTLEGILKGTAADGTYLEFDLNGDGTYEGSCYAGDTNTWTYNTQLTVGTYTVNVRSTIWDPVYGLFQHSQVSPLTFSVDTIVNAPPVIAELFLASDTGASATDHVTGNALIMGRITNDNGLRGLIIEFDLNGDGTSDGTAFTDAQGWFRFTPRVPLGAVSLQVRAVETYVSLEETVKSAWSPFTFTLVAEGFGPAYLTGVSTLQSPNASGAVYDATLSGRVRAAGDLANIIIEMDRNGDGVVDQSVWTDATGSFQIRPTGATYGTVAVALRTRRIEHHTGQMAVTNWENYSFVYAAAPALAITVNSMSVQQPTGTASDGTPKTQNGKIAGQLAGGTDYDGMTIQIDHNNDGVVDLTVTPESNGAFSATLDMLSVARHTVRARVQFLDEQGLVKTSAWASLTLEKEAVPETDPAITELRLDDDTGTSATDKVTANPTVHVTVARATAGQVVRFDLDSDDIVDGTATVDANGIAVWDPGELALPGRVAVRATLDDPEDLTQDVKWSSLSFYLSPTPDAETVQSLATQWFESEEAVRIAQQQLEEITRQSETDRKAAEQLAQNQYESDLNAAKQAWLQAQAVVDAEREVAQNVADEARRQAEIAAAQQRQNEIATNPDAEGYVLPPFQWPDAPPPDPTLTKDLDPSAKDKEGLPLSEEKKIDVENDEKYKKEIKELEKKKEKSDEEAKGKFQNTTHAAFVEYERRKVEVLEARDKELARIAAEYGTPPVKDLAKLHEAYQRAEELNEKGSMGFGAILQERLRLFQRVLELQSTHTAARNAETTSQYSPQSISNVKGQLTFYAPGSQQYVDLLNQLTEMANANRASDLRIADLDYNFEKENADIARKIAGLDITLFSQPLAPGYEATKIIKLAEIDVEAAYQLAIAAQAKLRAIAEADAQQKYADDLAAAEFEYEKKLALADKELAISLNDAKVDYQLGVANARVAVYDRLLSTFENNPHYEAEFDTPFNQYRWRVAKDFRDYVQNTGTTHKTTFTDSAQAIRAQKEANAQAEYDQRHSEAVAVRTNSVTKAEADELLVKRTWEDSSGEQLTGTQNGAVLGEVTGDPLTIGLVRFQRRQEILFEQLGLKQIPIEVEHRTKLMEATYAFKLVDAEASKTASLAYADNKYDVTMYISGPNAPDPDRPLLIAWERSIKGANDRSAHSKTIYELRDARATALNGVFKHIDLQLRDDALISNIVSSAHYLAWHTAYTTADIEATEAKNKALATSDYDTRVADIDANEQKTVAQLDFEDKVSSETRGLQYDYAAAYASYLKAVAAEGLAQLQQIQGTSPEWKKMRRAVVEAEKKKIDSVADAHQEFEERNAQNQRDVDIATIASRRTHIEETAQAARSSAIAIHEAMVGGELVIGHLERVADAQWNYEAGHEIAKTNAFRNITEKQRLVVRSDATNYYQTLLTTTSQEYGYWKAEAEMLRQLDVTELNNEYWYYLDLITASEKLSFDELAWQEFVADNREKSKEVLDAQLAASNSDGQQTIALVSDLAKYQVEQLVGLDKFHSTAEYQYVVETADSAKTFTHDVIEAMKALHTADANETARHDQVLSGEVARFGKTASTNTAMVSMAALDAKQLRDREIFEAQKNYQDSILGKLIPRADALLNKPNATAAEIKQGKDLKALIQAQLDTNNSDWVKLYDLQTAVKSKSIAEYGDGNEESTGYEVEYQQDMMDSAEKAANGEGEGGGVHDALKTYEIAVFNARLDALGGFFDASAEQDKAIAKADDKAQQAILTKREELWKQEIDARTTYATEVLGADNALYSSRTGCIDLTAGGVQTTAAAQTQYIIDLAIAEANLEDALAPLENAFLDAQPAIRHTQAEERGQAKVDRATEDKRVALALIDARSEASNTLRDTLRGIELARLERERLITNTYSTADGVAYNAYTTLANQANEEERQRLIGSETPSFDDPQGMEPKLAAALVKNEVDYQVAMAHTQAVTADMELDAATPAQEETRKQELARALGQEAFIEKTKDALKKKRLQEIADASRFQKESMAATNATRDSFNAANETARHDGTDALNVDAKTRVELALDFVDETLDITWQLQRDFVAAGGAREIAIDGADKIASELLTDATAANAVAIMKDAPDPERYKIDKAKAKLADMVGATAAGAGQTAGDGIIGGDYDFTIDVTEMVEVATKGLSAKSKIYVDNDAEQTFDSTETVIALETARETALRNATQVYRVAYQNALNDYRIRSVASAANWNSAMLMGQLVATEEYVRRVEGDKYAPIAPTAVSGKGIAAIQLAIAQVVWWNKSGSIDSNILDPFVSHKPQANDLNFGDLNLARPTSSADPNAPTLSARERLLLAAYQTNDAQNQYISATNTAYGTWSTGNVAAWSTLALAEAGEEVAQVNASSTKLKELVDGIAVKDRLYREANALEIRETRKFDAFTAYYSEIGGTYNDPPNVASLHNDTIAARNAAKEETASAIVALAESDRDLALASFDALRPQLLTFSTNLAANRRDYLFEESAAEKARTIAISDVVGDSRYEVAGRYLTVVEDVLANGKGLKAPEGTETPEQLAKRNTARTLVGAEVDKAETRKNTAFEERSADRAAVRARAEADRYFEGVAATLAYTLTVAVDMFEQIDARNQLVAAHNAEIAKAQAEAQKVRDTDYSIPLFDDKSTSRGIDDLGSVFGWTGVPNSVVMVDKHWLHWGYTDAGLDNDARNIAWPRLYHQLDQPVPSLTFKGLIFPGINADQGGYDPKPDGIWVNQTDTYRTSLDVTKKVIASESLELEEFEDSLASAERPDFNAAMVAKLGMAMTVEQLGQAMRLDAIISHFDSPKGVPSAIVEEMVNREEARFLNSPPVNHVLWPQNPYGKPTPEERGEGKIDQNWMRVVFPSSDGKSLQELILRRESGVDVEVVRTTPPPQYRDNIWLQHKFVEHPWAGYVVAEANSIPLGSLSIDEKLKLETTRYKSNYRLNEASSAYNQQRAQEMIGAATEFAVRLLPFVGTAYELREALNSDNPWEWVDVAVSAASDVAFVVSLGSSALVGISAKAARGVSTTASVIRATNKAKHVAHLIDTGAGLVGATKGIVEATVSEDPAAAALHITGGLINVSGLKHLAMRKSAWMRELSDSSNLIRERKGLFNQMIPGSVGATEINSLRAKLKNKTGTTIHVGSKRAELEGNFFDPDTNEIHIRGSESKIRRGVLYEEIQHAIDHHAGRYNSFYGVVLTDSRNMELHAITAAQLRVNPWFKLTDEAKDRLSEFFTRYTDWTDLIRP